MEIKLNPENTMIILFLAKSMYSTVDETVAILVCLGSEAIINHVEKVRK